MSTEHKRNRKAHDQAILAAASQCRLVATQTNSAGAHFIRVVRKSRDLYLGIYVSAEGRVTPNTKLERPDEVEAFCSALRQHEDGRCRFSFPRSEQ